MKSFKKGGLEGSILHVHVLYLSHPNLNHRDIYLKPQMGLQPYPCRAVTPGLGLFLKAGMPL